MITIKNIINVSLVLLIISFLQFLYTQNKLYSANACYNKLSDENKKILINKIYNYLKIKKISEEDMNDIAINIVYYIGITNDNIQNKIKTNNFFKYIDEII